MTITIEDITKIQTELFNEAQALVSKKGHDYSGTGKDTFRNIRMAAEVGLVDNASASVLVRLLDKINRMISLNNADPEVKNESIRDTVIDCINYATYWYALKMENSDKC